MINEKILHEIIKLSKSYRDVRRSYPEFVLNISCLKDNIIDVYKQYSNSSDKDWLINKLQDEIDYLMPVWNGGFGKKFIRYPNSYIKELLKIMSENNFVIKEYDEYKYLIDSVDVSNKEEKDIKESIGLGQLMFNLSNPKSKDNYLLLGIGNGLVSLKNQNKYKSGSGIETSYFGAMRSRIADYLIKNKNINRINTNFDSLDMYSTYSNNTYDYDKAIYFRPLQEEDASYLYYVLHNGPEDSDQYTKKIEPNYSSIPSCDEMHIVQTLISNIKDKAVMIVPNLLLSKNNKQYKEFRRFNLKYIESIIQLPKKTFKYSYKDYSIVVVDKKKKKKNITVINLENTNKYIDINNEIDIDKVPELVELINSEEIVDKNKKIISVDKINNEYFLLPSIYIETKKLELLSMNREVEDSDKLVRELVSLQKESRKIIQELKGKI